MSKYNRRNSYFNTSDNEESLDSSNDIFDPFDSEITSKNGIGIITDLQQEVSNIKNNNEDNKLKKNVNKKTKIKLPTDLIFTSEIHIQFVKPNLHKFTMKKLKNEVCKHFNEYGEILRSIVRQSTCKTKYKVILDFAHQLQALNAFRHKNKTKFLGNMITIKIFPLMTPITKKNSIVLKRDTDLNHVMNAYIACKCAQVISPQGPATICIFRSNSHLQRALKSKILNLHRDKILIKIYDKFELFCTESDLYIVLHGITKNISGHDILKALASHCTISYIIFDYINCTKRMYARVGLLNQDDVESVLALKTIKVGPTILYIVRPHGKTKLKHPKKSPPKEDLNISFTLDTKETATSNLFLKNKDHDYITLFISGIPDWNGLSSIAEQINCLGINDLKITPIKNVFTKVFKNACLLHLTNESFADKVLNSKIAIDTSPLNIEYFDSMKHSYDYKDSTVLVTNLDLSINDYELRKEFSIFGAINDTIILRIWNQSIGCGYVEFKTVKAATRAIQTDNLLIKETMAYISKPWLFYE